MSLVGYGLVWSLEGGEPDGRASRARERDEPVPPTALPQTVSVDVAIKRGRFEDYALLLTIKKFLS